MSHPNTDQTSRDTRIAALAHEMWEEEGRPEGQSETHWLKAAKIVDDQDQDEIEAQAAKPKK